MKMILLPVVDYVLVLEARIRVEMLGGLRCPSDRPVKIGDFTIPQQVDLPNDEGDDKLHELTMSVRNVFGNRTSTNVRWKMSVLPFDRRRLLLVFAERG